MRRVRIKTCSKPGSQLTILMLRCSPTESETVATLVKEDSGKFWNSENEILKRMVSFHPRDEN